MIDWYFDFVSPFAYLQCRRLARTPAIAERLRCHPVLLAALLDRVGQLGPAEIPAKRELTYRYLLWRTRRDEIPFTMPPAHPFNPLPLLRLAVAAGPDFPTVRRIFDWVWCEGRLPDDASALAALARELRVDDWPNRAAQASVKDAVRRETENAAAAGVFGVPSAIVNGRLFWGDDQTEMLFEYSARPELFSDDAYTRLLDLPVAASRRTSGR